MGRWYGTEQGGELNAGSEEVGGVPTGVVMAFGVQEMLVHNPHVCGPAPDTDYTGGTLYRLPGLVLLLQAMRG